MATDLAESYRSGLNPHLVHARRVADPFHVTRAANRCVDAVRRRVQNETLGHRGRKGIRSIGSASCCSPAPSVSTTPAVAGCCSACVSVIPMTRTSGPGWPRILRDIYLTDDPAQAATLVDKAIAACSTDDVEEIHSLGKTLSSWRAEILAHHHSGASNGPTEGLNLLVKKVKRCGHGFRNFENYRLRVLLHAGGVSWPDGPSPPRLRTRSPHSDA